MIGTHSRLNTVRSFSEAEDKDKVICLFPDKWETVSVDRK